MGVQDRPQCFFDVEINREPVGRIMFQLFSDICPKTCKNFLCLCSGEKGIGKTTGKKLYYKGTTFHRVVKNFMIQGGDFSEGNGKGGESIYGGYFKDENFILKHDRAFLLSMANRGKHTNGSQFFITTKPAPHLDGVHVVFGLVISGFEVIEQIENLKTDTASRPYADVRVIDCGVLTTRSAKDALEKKRKVCSDSEASDSSSSSESSSSETSSESEAENERSRRRKRKRRAKAKQSRKRRKEERKKEDSRCKRTSNQRRLSDKSDVNEKAADTTMKRDKPVVRPEEIPPVPENRFLLRRDVSVVNVEPEPKLLDAAPVLSDQKPSVSKSGRKIKGRGTIRYHTPPRSRSHSESDDDESSETPPHWKEEMQRLRTYRPPSGEKWSKGDKLSDPCTSRWDERSASRRSRSWSHNGYSDLNTVRYSSRHKKHRKEKKKMKHKKKSKKQKHFKKHKQTKKKKTSPSDVDSSRSFPRRTKSSGDRERKSRSSSLSSRRSSRRDWSKSDKEDHSSSTLSSRDTRSYYRSRSRSRSRSKSRSYSRGSSRSRSASKSSYSRSRSRSSSNSRHQKTVPNSPQNISARLKENKSNKTAEPVRAVTLPSDKVVVPPVVPENLPVIRLSDSPPPSRWKPGQKPWKPSYERIQEMKTKTTHLVSAQTNYSLVIIKETNVSSSYRKQERSSESDRSASSKYRSDRSSDSWQRSRSRSSGSRSYSRSYTRSRSPSSSRTKSQSSGRSPSLSKYRSGRSDCSESTSYYSLSSDERRRTKRKSASRERNSRPLKIRKETSSKGTLRYKGAKDCDESSQGLKESDSLSSSDLSTDSEPSIKTKVSREKEGRFQLEDDAQKQNNLNSERGEEKTKRERATDGSKKKTVKEKSSGQSRGGAKARRKPYSSSKWDSESNSERGDFRHKRGDSRASSGKEEGEASSGSDTERSVIKRTKRKSNYSESVLDSDGTWKTSKQQSSSSESESYHSSSVNTKGKSKKIKHGSKKNLKKSHSKKGKDKSKGKKEKKHKVQKRKELFHWQPPLEFGEEDDDDVTEKPVTKDDKEKQLIKDIKDKKQDTCKNDESLKDVTGNGEKSCVEESFLGKNATNDTSPDHSKLNKDNTGPSSSTSALSLGVNATASTNEIKHTEESNQNGLEDVIQTDDNMEICTPDRNSPGKMVVEVLSPVLGAKPQAFSVSMNKDIEVETPEPDAVKLGNNILDLINIKEEKEVGKQENSSVPVSSAKDISIKSEITENTQSNVGDNKWKPLQGIGNLQSAAVSTATETKNAVPALDTKPTGLRIEIKAKNKVRPGSLFDEVRKTARLSQRPRNQESSSEEESPSRDDNSLSRSLSRSRSKSESKSRHRTRSISYSHSRSRSRSSTYSYRSRSSTRSRSRGWYSRDRSRSRSSSYPSYNSRSRSYSRSRSRSSSYGHRSRSSRSYSYDSYYSRSRSRSKRSDSYRRSRSYDRRSRSYGSDSESDRSYSNNRSPSESSRYS
ncbi:NK-tumor recognition protein isoform X2 [Nothoprocta perdicaria]|uniref:NK-tumor recognition protein isoform X2 n=1 Tax=Nothoprocta perdicaria TaxID=30464 RepID=UPI000E1C006F|nr:NK-tumor recognition protein isoform X2 [Nothoprocta perdicaria]